MFRFLIRYVVEKEEAERKGIPTVFQDSLDRLFLHA